MSSDDYDDPENEGEGWVTFLGFLWGCLIVAVGMAIMISLLAGGC